MGVKHVRVLPGPLHADDAPGEPSPVLAGTLSWTLALTRQWSRSRKDLQACSVVQDA